MRDWFNGGPKDTAARQKRAHDHRAPLEYREFRCGQRAHAGFCARKDAKPKADQECGQQQHLPVEAEVGCGEVEAPIDHARQKINVDQRQHTEHRDEPAGDGEQGFVHPAKAVGLAADCRRIRQFVVLPDMAPPPAGMIISQRDCCCP